MRKISVLIIVALAFIVACSVQQEIRRADTQLNRGNLDRSLEHVQTAMEEEATKNDPELWLVKARLYIEIAFTEQEEFKDLVDDPLLRANAAVEKAEELDTDNLQLLEIQQTKLILSEAFYNQGAEYYNQQDFGRASNFFLTSYRISESFGTIDTATLYNAGLAAEVAGMDEQAYQLYVQVEEMDYEQPYLYSSLANISLRRENIEEAENWIEKGRDRFPEDLDLIFTEANVHLTSGNIPEARRILEIAIEKDPENANLHYAFAVNFDQMSKDTTFTKEEREFAFDEAVKAYNRALELDPDNFDARYNLGALFFNEGIQLFLQADDILRGGYTQENLQKANKLEEKSKEIWSEEAQPHLEQALDLIDYDNENYEIVLRSLRELYMRTDQREKLEETNEIWQERFADPEEEEE